MVTAAPQQHILLDTIRITYLPDGYALFSPTDLFPTTTTLDWQPYQHLLMIEERKRIMAFQLPDPTTPFGERVARRLREDSLIWLTTIDSKNTPQPNPVWFLWDVTTSTILVYSKAGAKRHKHVQKNPQVSLNFDGNGNGGDIIVFTGEARLSPDAPSADQHSLFLAKNQNLITRDWTTAENYAAHYPVALRIYLNTLRGF